jgi:hypothetical protein
MSSSNAAAIRRRVTKPSTANPNLPPSQIESQPKKNQSMTIQQAMISMDKRLKELEQPNSQVDPTPENLDVLIGEINHRFELVVTELAELKDTLLKLQTYTMDVNKTLLDERINLMSDIGVSRKLNTSDQTDTDLNSVITIQSEQSKGSAVTFDLSNSSQV